MVGKRVISPTYKWGIPWGYNPLTNHLLTARDIPVNPNLTELTEKTKHLRGRDCDDCDGDLL